MGNVEDNIIPESGTDCSHILERDPSAESGVYKIILWKTKKDISVFCDMDRDGGGWTVFHNRFDGSVDFYRNFSEYENGFGALDGEFWLGTDCSHILERDPSAESGVYKIVLWKTKKEISVFCDMDRDGGGWTVFHNRFDGSVDFYRDFSEYENGFGALDGEFG
ncbi:fibrinogen-like protein 1 [Mercenaria mercenaria]|uniref:fibrinogen-like protein 1 n=1 Tax=Mercenaria mercenaria TaxID=6596 RepID=UPI00234EEDD4|nr:fibrinogen-like protein 1 [Mercenaria mercenaria]